MRILLLLFSGLIVFISQGQQREKLQKIDAALEYLHQRQLFNGVVLIGDKGKIIYKKVLGIKNPAGEPLSITSSFNLASVSKQFYTLMIMKLYEQGKLKYDDRVQKHIPEFPYTTITIRHLMNQTSGLPEYFDLADREMTLLDTLTNTMLLDLLATRKPALVFEPGERWEYCNTNYTTLGSVIEAVSGMPVYQFFNKTISEPLKTKNLYVYNLKMKTLPLSRVVGVKVESGKPVPYDLNRFDGIMGDGNVYASAEDLFTWDQALYGNKLVKKEIFQQAITPGKLNNGEAHRYGFGWFIDEPSKVVSHTGSWVGFRNLIVRYIDRNQTLIVLTSGNNGSARVIRNIWEGKSYTLPTTNLITNVRVIDGTGSPAYPASVRLVNDRISDMGELNAFAGEAVTDGKGNILAPGFIDSHSHHDWGLKENPLCLAANSQGITTIVVGQDGSSHPMDSISALFQVQPVSVNIASYTGHATLRELSMQKSVLRKSTPEELEIMKKALTEELDKGSLGLSTGLEYEEGFYASRHEVIELAKVAAGKGGRYISHIRSEDIHMDEAVNELLDIGREANIPVQISHLKIALRSNWGSAGKLLADLQQARQMGIQVTADVYPYSMWGSTPRVLFPKKDFTNLQSAEFAVTELFDPGASIMAGYPANRNFEGKTITAIAKLNSETPAQALVRIIRDGEAAGESGYIVATSMSESDIRSFLQWEHSSICSDGAIDGHPRGHGAFTRVLGRYVREQKIMPLEKAVYKMTGLPAESLGINNRGLIKPGYYADLVLFNPETVADQATIENPKALSAGVEKVWVNGQVVFEQQKSTGARSGKLVKRQE